MAAAAILNFTKVECWATVTLVWPMSTGLSNSTQISSFLTAIWPKNKIQDNGSRHLEFSTNAILSPCNPRMVNVNIQTKFGANRSRSGRDTHACVFPRWWPSAILDSLFTNFGPPTKSHRRVVSFLPMAWRSDLMWPRHCDFTSLVIWLKMPVRTHFGQFFGQNREGVRYWPPTNSFSLLGVLPPCHFSWKSIKKWDRESADRQTDAQTDPQTHTRTQKWFRKLSRAML